MPQAQPELKKVMRSKFQAQSKPVLTPLPQYLDKRVEVQLNGSRKVLGTLRGYDVSVLP